ncbi:MAG: hypothetical protein WC867_00140 [Candidatus Pacearchaeota archaeon]|jgi:hypothetical protein
MIKETFHIPDLIPLEDYVREPSLKFLTQVYRTFGTLEFLELNPPIVRKIGNWYYVEDGNHRCVWNLINGNDKINAYLEIPTKEEIKSTLSTVKSTRKFGIYSMEDLVNLVEDKEKYTSNGSIDYKITREDLKNPNYNLLFKL